MRKIYNFEYESRNRVRNLSRRVTNKMYVSDKTCFDVPNYYVSFV